MKKIEAIVFDFDGTLAELTIDFSDMKRKLKALGSAFMDPLPDKDELPALEWVDYMADCLSNDDPDLGKEFHTRCRFLIISMELEAARTGNLFPFTCEVLNGLGESGIKTGVITRNTGSAVREMVPDIDKISGCFLSREDVENVKPHPDHLFKALEMIGVSATSSLMVGDHHIDIETGKRAGTMTAGVATGRVSIDELNKADPDFVAADCAELIKILKNKNLL
ncbi:HAD family hydrolase [Maridesulfovibrio hydrothermalis]|uniref:phosphoglycolate phosphatase n=1 Tax=Maridesulfovibrio hydrothermalis AM13 = DSM 14728 TaxID=1121451 RepID=L0RA32_9BACT|nr:HAD family hydrolase [Maridesulfovibrio hydrothermalis]CCO23077.1 HAD-superfamily hydrolase, subfamily IA, variant 1 [Maridesulfovibrio hydrothermalis AM13 = DSM 14728]